MMMKARAHQRDAIAALTSRFLHEPRATLVAACGTGKTLIAARTAISMAGTGRTLVVVPTLDLLTQTARAWREAGRGGAAVAVCSAQEALRHDRDADRDAQITTSAERLATLIRPDEPVSVFATYASLPVLLAAHRDHGLARWDFGVIDEAHRTAGRMGKAWAAIHRDEHLPIARRLYQTATPRIWASDALASTPVATMDDASIFGPVAYRLGFGQAIEAGLLADYDVLVPVVADADVHQLLTEHEGMDAEAARTMALQIAILRAIRDRGLRRVVSYHRRVAAARALATSLPSTAEGAELLPEAPLWVRWIAGSQSYATRSRLIDEFGQHTGTAIIANARVFGEGIDVPDIDAVAFAEAKGSAVDTVQAVGRAVRQQPGAGKRATIIVPVYVGSHQDDPEMVIESSAYAPLWQTLRALRAHDDRFATRLRFASTPSASEAAPAGTPQADWLRVIGAHAPNPATLALAINLRAVAPKSAEWRRGFQAAKRYHRRHGHLDAPQSHTEPDGFNLGSWLSWQRHLHSLHQVAPERLDALNQLGMVWQPRVDQWQRGFTHAQAFAASHGHLAVPSDYEHDGFKLGAWIRNQRSRFSEIPTDRRELLDQLDVDWNPAWPLSWQRNYQAARAFFAEHGHVRIPRTHISADGLCLGEWIHAQRRRRAELAPGQVQRLDALGMDWTAISPHELAWQAGLAAARAYLAEHGNLQVPQRYIAPDGYRLGVWVNNQRRRRDTLAPERVRILNALGMIWTTTGARTRKTVTAP